MTRVLLAAGLLAVLTVSVATFQPRGTVSAHFHHVHVNSTDPAVTQEFYQKTFGAERYFASAGRLSSSRMIRS